MAQRYYQSIGYNYMEVPWIISKEANYITKLISPNKDARDYETFAGQLVASGEQSFIQLMLDEKMPIGKFFCVTPCFRDEITQNEITKEYFIKLELIHYMNFEDCDLIIMTDDVKKFFYKYFHYDNISVLTTDMGYDIESLNKNNQKIELGSYGVRSYKKHKWIYGTGLAEPRFSYARINQREVNE